MNKTQTNILIGIILCIIITFLYPPHAYILDNSVIDMGFSFIWKLPKDHVVYVNLLLVEWLGIGLIGGILYFLTKGKN